MGHIMMDFGGPQQRLGRDAAPVEADAAKLFALDDRSLQTQLAGANGGNIPSRARTKDDEVVSICQDKLLKFNSGGPWALSIGPLEKDPGEQGDDQEDRDR